jgi:PAS domain S-box-containing protein
MRAVRQFLRSYRVPLIAVALATLHSLLFWSLGPRVPLGLCVGAVMVSAWLGGLRPAVVATALSTLVLAVIYHYQAPGPGDDLVLRLGLFVLVGLIAGYLSQQCKQAIRAVDHVHDILGGGGVALISADGAGRVTALNPLARTLTGLGAADAHGLPLGQVFRLVHGPARQPLSLPPAGTARELPEGSLLLTADGGETAVEGTVGPVRDADGRPAGVMIVFREAGGRAQAWHELRQRADRFRALAGYAPAGLMVLDAEGRCVFCNPAAQSACGCTADECLGEGWSRHVRPQDRDRLISDWLRAVVGKAPFADEFRVVTAPGAERWLRVRSAPMLADGGEVLGHVAALDEVTERRRAEEALADARRESEEHLQEWSASEKKAEEALRAARAELEGRLQEQAAARQAAEESWRKAQGQLDERGTALRRGEEALAEARQEAREQGAARKHAEEALEVARADAERQSQEQAAAQQAAEEALAARQRAEDELRRLRDEMQQLTASRGPSAEELRAATQAVGDAWRKEVEAVVAMHRDAHARLQSALAERDGTAEALRKEMARLEEEAGAARQAHDRLQEQLAQRGDSEEALRRELERLGADASALRQSHDHLQAALAQKDGAAEALRKELAEREREVAEAREAQDRLRATLAEKGGTEEFLRQEQERLRREKEFLEGVIDGSPAGIFAHDRDGRCRVWNPALERLLDRPRAEALGRTATELFPPADADGKHTPEAAPGLESGVTRAELAAGGIIGRSVLLETAHAPIRDQAGEVVGGMALVRVLPMPAPREEPAPAAGQNGTGRQAPAAARLGDIDWLAFN